MKDFTALVDRMINYRAEHDLTQAQLAEKCRLSTQTICMAENGYENLSKVSAAKIRAVVMRDEQ